MILLFKDMQDSEFSTVNSELIKFADHRYTQVYGIFSLSRIGDLLRVGRWIDLV